LKKLVDNSAGLKYLIFSGYQPHKDPQMTIQTIAQKQLDQPTTLYFTRKSTSDCYWFDYGNVMSYSDSDMNGRCVSLGVDDLAATDWSVMNPSK
jgi:hypothetical protein